MIIRNGKRKAGVVWIAAIIMTLVMSMSFSPVSYADTEVQGSNVSVEDLNKSINIVINSVDQLKNIIDMTPEEQNVIQEIFGGFTSIAGGAISVIGVVNATTSFLKLIGLMQDPTATALANITQQIADIKEKLADMDRKLDDISEEMARMEAVNEFNVRGIKAGQMLSEWHKFEHDYMEASLDELMNDYDTMVLNHVRDWIEFKKEGSRQTESDGVRTDKVVVLYKGGNPLDPNAKLTFKAVAVNDIDPEHNKRDMAKPDPYTMYADDDDLNVRYDKFLILDDTFLPARGDIAWNVNTYRNNLISFFKGKLNKLREDARGAGYDTDHVKEQNMKIDQWSDADIDKYAEGIVDSIMYRINYVMINESADFAKDLYKQFGEYCTHVKDSQQGVSAMLKSIYLTNAFEFEARDTIEAFCNQMILKTGVYGMFATNVMGMSENITDNEKLNTAGSMCEAITAIKASLDNGITGNDNYCYVTNSALNYADVTFSGSVDVEYYIRGAVSGYRSYSAQPMQTVFDSDEKLDGQPVLVGDTNLLLVGYLLRNNGTVLDHDFMNEHFTTTKRTKKSALITSLKGEQRMTTDTPLLMKTHKLIGGYFYNDPQIYLNNLPRKATEGYLVYRQRITGSVVDPETLSLTQNRALFGTAAYGESHWNWEVDEAAVMGGPVNDPTFKETVKEDKVDDGIVTDTYKGRYRNSVQYNCLLQIPVNHLTGEPGPQPLDELKDISKEIPEIAKAKESLEKLIEKAEKVKNPKGWTSASITKFKKAIAEAKEICENEHATATELDIEKERLQAAWDHFRSIAKKDQKMKVKVTKKNVKAKALSKSKKVVKAFTVKNAKGKVTYKKVSVAKKKYAKKFRVNKKTGKITIAKGLKKGTYKIRIKVKAAGNNAYLPAVKTVTVKIRVK